MNYKIKCFTDDIYEVLDTESYEVVFQGDLSDCYAWIKLEEGGNFDY